MHETKSAKLLYDVLGRVTMCEMLQLPREAEN